MFPFLRAFAKLRKATISFAMPTRLSFILSVSSHGITRLPPPDLHAIWYLSFFSRKLSRKFNFHQNLTRIIGNLHECTFVIICLFQALGLCDRTSWANCEEREKTNKMQQSDVYYQHCLNMFRASLCPSSGEQRPCVTACGMLRWFCWMWLVAVVGRCVVGCSHPTRQRPTTATNHIQQNQRSIPHAVTHGLCSPEDGHNDARNMLRQCW